MANQTNCPRCKMRYEAISPREADDPKRLCLPCYMETERARALRVETLPSNGPVGDSGSKHDFTYHGERSFDV